MVSDCVGAWWMSPGSVTNPQRGLCRHQGPACTTRVAASEVWMVTATGTSLAGRSGEIQVTLCKHSHITEHRVWRVRYTNCFHFAKLTTLGGGQGLLRSPNFQEAEVVQEMWWA